MATGVLVLDASPLNHFARARHLATLQKLIAKHDCVTTRAVIGELQKGAERHPDIGDARFPAAASENLFDWARSQHLI